MAQAQQPVTVPQDSWQELTNADAAEITFQVLAGRVMIRRDGAAAPAADVLGWIYGPDEGERNIALADLGSSPGSRVWAKSLMQPCSRVLVDHA